MVDVAPKLAASLIPKAADPKTPPVIPRRASSESLARRLRVLAQQHAAQLLEPGWRASERPRLGLLAFDLGRVARDDLDTVSGGGDDVRPPFINSGKRQEALARPAVVANAETCPTRPVLSPELDQPTFVEHSERRNPTNAHEITRFFELGSRFPGVWVERADEQRHLDQLIRLTPDNLDERKLLRGHILERCLPAGELQAPVAPERFRGWHQARLQPFLPPPCVFSEQDPAELVEAGGSASVTLRGAGGAAAVSFESGQACPSPGRSDPQTGCRVSPLADGDLKLSDRWNIVESRGAVASPKRRKVVPQATAPRAVPLRCTPSRPSDQPFALPPALLAQQDVAELLEAGGPVGQDGEDVPAVVAVEHGRRLSRECRSVDRLGRVLSAVALQTLHEFDDEFIAEEGAGQPHAEACNCRSGWLNRLAESFVLPPGVLGLGAALQFATGSRNVAFATSFPDHLGGGGSVSAAAASRFGLPLAGAQGLWRPSLRFAPSVRG